MHAEGFPIGQLFLAGATNFSPYSTMASSNKAPPARLRGVQFGLLTDAEIRNQAVLEVNEATLHTRGCTKAGGPADARFGSSSRFMLCGHCKQGVDACPGHTGFIAFPYPMPHVGFCAYLQKVINCFCFNCSTFLMPELDPPVEAVTPRRKLAFYYDEGRRARSRKRSPLRCPNPECGLLQPFVRVEEPFFTLEWQDDNLEAFFGSEVTGRAPVAKRAKRESTQAPAPADCLANASIEQRRADYRHFVLEPFTNWDAYAVLGSVRPDDLARIGINVAHTHPSGMLMLSLLVPAIGVRPTMGFDDGTGRRSYHQLTRKLAEIVKQRRALHVEASNSRFHLEDQSLHRPMPEPLRNQFKLFYVTVSHYLMKDKCRVADFRMSQYASRAHARAVSVSQALQGKHGRYRETTMGKRVDFCARTVVCPHPMADVDQIGVPRALARRLTIPVRITNRNKADIRRMLLADEAMQLRDPRSGQMVKVTAANAGTVPLLEGWDCERYLRDDDVVPINRQPTLHRPSIQGLRVKLHDDRVLKLHPAATIPFNADHDGDEMNMHVVQTAAGRAEVQELMALPNHILNPRSNRPVIGLIQDALVGGYYLSQQATFFDRAAACRLIAVIEYDRDAAPHLRLGDPASKLPSCQLPPPAIARPRPLWTGKQLFSLVLPRLTFTRTLKNRPAAVGDDPLLDPAGRLVVYNGELLLGTLCKQSLGPSDRGIIHLAALLHSNNVAARFISDAQRLLQQYLSRLGFSIGIRECVAGPQLQEMVKTVLREAHAHIAKIEARAATLPDSQPVQRLAEDCIANTLKKIPQMVGNIVCSQLGPKNTFYVMSHLVGSKGSIFNLSQVLGLVGQTFVNGVRPAPTGSGQRVLPSAPLPHQPKQSLAARLAGTGLHARPFKAGLSMADSFIACMGGREGLVDTAAKTSRTGYIQRRMVKALESHHVAQDGTVRDAHNALYQRKFGVDGFDPALTLRVGLPELLLDDAALRSRCVLDVDDPAGDHEEWQRLRAARDTARRAKQTCYHPVLAREAHAYLPIDVRLLTPQRRAQCGCTRFDAIPTEASALRRCVDQLCDAVGPHPYLELHLRAELGTARLAHHHKLCPECAVAVAQRALQLVRAARMEPGEGIGALTATSIGEPLSQITLNSFHFSGSDNVAMVHGVPRIKELVGASRNLATPLVSLLLRPGLPNPRRAAETLVKNLPHTMLRSLLLDSRVLHEPDPLACSSDDGHLQDRHRAFLNHAKPRILPWVLRLQLCPERVGARALEPRMIADLVQERFGDTALVISSHVSDPEWVIRVYLLDTDGVVAAAMKRSLDTGTTRAAAKRASQRASLNSRRRRKHADLTAYVGGAGVPIPLELLGKGPVCPTTRQVVEWMVSRNHLHELVSEMKVCGVDGIEAAAVRVTPRSVIDQTTGAVTDVDEVWIDARGNNVVDCAQIEVFAGSRTLTNDVMKVYEVAGITAAAHTLFHEICTCLGAAGSRVDERHVKLVCDAMCHDGFVMPFSRHGLNRMAKHGVLAKITFEEVLDQLVEAAVFGYFDPLHGVSENIMLGRPVTFGSNLSIVCTESEDGALVPCATSHAPPPETDTKVVRSVVVDADARDTLLEAQNDLVADTAPPIRAALDVRPAPRGTTSVRMFSPDEPEAPGSSPLKTFRPSSPQIDQRHWSVRDAEPFRPSSPELL